MQISEARNLWEPEPGWLDTASYGLPPTPAWDALQQALDQWRHGRTSWKAWDESVGLGRASFARLVGVPPRDVAIGAAVSQLLGPVAAALPEGSRVVVPESEFTSSLFPWLVHADRGLEVLTVPADRVPESVTPGTTLVCVSAVQSADG